MYTVLAELGYTVGFVFLPYHIGVIVPVNELHQDVKELIVTEGTVTLDSTRYAYIEPNEVVSPGIHPINKEDIILYKTVDDNLNMLNVSKIPEQLKKSYEVVANNIL